MNPFESMTNVTIYTAITVVVLLICSLRMNPLTAATSFLRTLVVSRKFLLHFVALLAILMINKLELIIEENMNYTANFTQTFYEIEQNFIPMMQSFFKNDVLTFVTSYFYVVVFSCIMIVSIILYATRKDHKLFYAVCYAIMINYMVAIPFYLFFPVDEVWAHHPTVKLLILDVFPTFEQDYRPLSGINNCFPSLHTSLSITLAVIAAHSGNRFWRVFTTVSAGIVIFAIFYLGIHWFLDMCAGLVLGAFAARTGLKMAEGRVMQKPAMGTYNGRNLHD